MGFHFHRVCEVHRDRKKNDGCQGLGKGKWGVVPCFRGTEFQMCKMRRFWRSVSQEREYTQRRGTVYLRMGTLVTFRVWVFPAIKEKENQEKVASGEHTHPHTHTAQLTAPLPARVCCVVTSSPERHYHNTAPL